MGISFVVMFSVNKGMLVLMTPYGFQNAWFGYIVDGGACTWSYVAYGLLYLWQLFYINVHKKKVYFKYMNLWWPFWSLIPYLIFYN